MKRCSAADSTAPAPTILPRKSAWFDSVDADAFAATALSLTFDALPHFLRDAEALVASSLMAAQGARVQTG